LEIAAGLARVHCRFAGAVILFNQCGFRGLEPDEHFIAVRPAPASRDVWRWSYSRGRTAVPRNQILVGFTDLLTPTHVPQLEDRHAIGAPSTMRI
jgi:hypothetical protein